MRSVLHKIWSHNYNSNRFDDHVSGEVYRYSYARLGVYKQVSDLIEPLIRDRVWDHIDA